MTGLMSVGNRGRQHRRLIPVPRSHVGCGMDPKGVMAELTGRRRPAIPRARAAPCICQQGEGTSMAGTASLGAQFNRHRPGLCPQAQEGRADRDLLSGRWRGQSGAGL